MRKYENDSEKSKPNTGNIIAFLSLVVAIIALLWGDGLLDRFCPFRPVPDPTTPETTTSAVTALPVSAASETTEPVASSPVSTASETTEPPTTINPQDRVRFGQYEQDGKSTNGTEKIVWIVLDVNGNDALIISRDVLDVRPYHAQKTDTSWENCSLRTWLNSTFLNAAFSSNEQAGIKTSKVAASKNPKFSTDPGSNTEDKIFLLSIDEVRCYMPEDSDRLCRPTQYAFNQGAYVNPATQGTWWWLRTPGSSRKDAASVNSDGTIDYDDGSVNSSKGTVRPALWVDKSMLVKE